jgi:DNA-binding transcriptional LysR family regulator
VQKNGEDRGIVFQKWKTLLDWNDLRFFLGVARTGSLTRTAIDLRVSPSTVSRRITAFEESLGTRFFAHHQTGYFLTDEGRDVLRRAEMVEESIVALERGASGLDASASGVVRLATAENLATHLIIPALPVLAKRHPGIRLEIVTGIDTLGLSRHEADIALRLVRPDRGNLTVRKVGTMAYAVYGTKDCLKRHPASEEKPLVGRPFVIWDEGHAHLPAARWVVETVPDLIPALVTTSLAAQVAGASAGVGLAVLPCFLAAPNRSLVRVVHQDSVFLEDLWLVTHADLSASARVRAVGEFVANTVARAGESLSGARMR